MGYYLLMPKWSIGNWKKKVQIKHQFAEFCYTLPLENIRPIAIFRCKIRRFFAIFSKTTQDTETLYTSFESSNIQLLGARRTGDVVIPYDSQNPLIETRTFFTKRGVADLFGGPRPLSLGLQRAAY